MMDTQQENQISDINLNSAEPASVGKILRAAREEMGLSVNDVANRIKFAPRQVEYLEDDDYTKLPEAAFVRGFIRSYARLLELDPSKLISGLPSSHVKTATAQEMKSVEIPMPTELSSRRYNIMLLAAGLVIALSVAIYERMHDRSPEVTEPVVKNNVQSIELPNVKAGDSADTLPVEEQPPVTEQQAAIRVVPAPVSQQTASQTVNRVVPASAPPQTTSQTARVVPVPQIAVPHAVVRATPAPVPAPKSVPVTASTTAGVVIADKPKVDSETNSVEHALRLEFDEDSWVEIKDASDKPLAARMYRAGSLARVTGKAPLMVIIGNARAVRLFDNGKKVNLERYTTAEVAHITLK